MKNMHRSNLNAALAAFTAVLLAACGGGGGSMAGIDGTGITPSPQPGPATAVAVGTVTAFGSVFVNGVHFDTSSTSFTIDGQSGTQTDLAVGDVVTVVGSLSAGDPTQGTAQSILFNAAVEGPVTAIDAAASTLVVLGQTVSISADTSFDNSIQPPDLTGLAVGDIIEVSGFPASDGTISATRIEPEPGGLEFETTGRVTGLDAAGLSFSINALSVDYSTAMLVDFAGGQVADGDLVEVTGASFGASGELIATRVEYEGGNRPGQSGDHVEVEGLVTRFVDAADFDVAGFPVTTTSRTVYENGGAADLGLDVKLEVEGTLITSGAVVASKIDIRRARAVRISGPVDSIDVVAGSLKVLGIAIKVDALTRIEDKSSQDVEPFSVADLAVGDFVETRGAEVPAGSGEVLASLLERDEPDPEVELQGFVDSVSGTELSILGVRIVTGSASFRDIDGNSISSASFFNQVQAGSLVKAVGTASGAALIDASQVEFEHED